MTEALLVNGAKVNDYFYGKVIIDHACENANLDAILVFIKHGAVPSTVGWASYGSKAMELPQPLSTVIETHRCLIEEAIVAHKKW